MRRWQTAIQAARGSHSLKGPRAPLRVLIAAIPVAGATIAANASALGPLEFEVAPKVGGATSPGNTPAGYGNPLGYGGGLRAGVVLWGLYAGASIVALAGPLDLPTPGPPGAAGSATTWVATLMTGVEAGYGLTFFNRLILRIQAGFGNIVNSTLFPSSNTNLYLEPGGTILWRFVPEHWFLGADANALILPKVTWAGPPQTDVAVTAHGQVGYSF